MAGMRDKLIHDYIGVDLWAVITDILPVFKTSLEQIIAQEQGSH